jgi:uncharacterized protein
MVESVARVATEQPGRYIKQLVSHLGHKVTKELADDGTGRLSWESGGRVTLTADDGLLVIVATAADDEELVHIRGVVGRHLERFGTREGLHVNWSDSASTGS